VIRAALFDIGGVLLVSPFEAFAAYEERRGLPSGFLREVNATNHHANAWARLERGELDLDEFGAAFEEESAALGHRVPGGDVLALLGGEPRPAVCQAVLRCAERLKTALLTNNVVPMDDTPLPPELAAVFETVDCVVQSSMEGIRKPEPEFYRRACSRLGVEPADCVFLDDLGVNLKPARQMGMTTIKVEDPTVALAELAATVNFPLT
jgi:putative hydrolase of the HAD superfamily